MSFILLEKITKYYGNKDHQFRALDDITLTISSSETVCLAGPSGSGKTTLLNILGAIDTPNLGRYLLDGEPITHQSDSRLTQIREQKIGFIFQNYNLIPVLTAYENVEYPLLLRPQLTPQHRREAVTYFLEKVGLGQFLNRYPSQLSGGQQQRVAIARALVKRPKLILADEPTANLDSHTSEDILTLLNTLNSEEKTTLIYASHDPQVMAHSQRIISLNDGKLI